MSSRELTRDFAEISPKCGNSYAKKGGDTGFRRNPVCHCFVLFAWPTDADTAGSTNLSLSHSHRAWPEPVPRPPETSLSIAHTGQWDLVYGPEAATISQTPTPSPPQPLILSHKHHTGEWDLVYGSETLTRASPFFSAFRNALSGVSQVQPTPDLF